MNIISYLICSFLMFFIGNIQSWLKPILIAKDYPDWMYESFSFYAIIYVAAGLLSTFVAQSLKPKTEHEKELLSLRKKEKTFEKKKQAGINKALAEQKDKHADEVNRIKANHRRELVSQRVSHEKEINNHQCTIKVKDQMISLMTGQLAEKYEIIGSYNRNAESNPSQENRRPESNIGNIIPDIGDYS